MITVYAYDENSETSFKWKEIFSLDNSVVYENDENGNIPFYNKNSPVAQEILKRKDEFCLYKATLKKVNDAFYIDKFEEN